MTATHAPVSDAEFADLMGRVGPFEPSPTIAVATSGGADSLALALLAHGWARRRGGAAIAVTVDHGLRPDSGAEAARVGAWLATAGVRHVVLPWRGSKPRTGIQAAARRARQALIEGWCRDAGVLHLVLGHQRDDQAETFLMRRRHGSGPDGLAAMAAIVERRDARVLRPLLDVDRARLEATLAARGQPWIDDPSNRDARFERAVLRADLRILARRGWPAVRLAAAAAHHARARMRSEAALIPWLAGAVTLHPAGFAMIDRAAWRAACPGMRAAALARVVTTVGGLAYPPAATACARLAASDAGTRTLGGCVIVPRREAVIVAREPRAARSAVALGVAPVVWDDRFHVVPGSGFPSDGGLELRRLGDEGRRWLDGCMAPPWPRVTIASLPALWRLDAVVAVPHLHFNRFRMNLLEHLSLSWRPRRPLLAPFIGATAAPAAAVAARGGRAKMPAIGAG